MRFATLAVALALAAHGVPGYGQAAVPLPIAQAASSAEAIPLTLPQAWATALSAHPTLRARQAQLAAAQAAVDDAAAWLHNNPQLALESTRRAVPQTGLPDEARREWQAGVSQTFELAGQPGHRRRAAQAALQALRAEVDDTRQQVRADVAQQFHRVLAQQQRVALEEQALALLDATATAVQRRRAAGEDTKLDANVAQVEAERARNQLALAQEQLVEARAQLAAALQLPPGVLPLVQGSLKEQGAWPYTLDDLLARAATHPRLSALAAHEQAATAKLSLEQAARSPDVTVGLSTGREGPANGRERLTTLSLSLPLPLFKRNVAAIGTAQSGLTQATAAHQAGQRDTQAEVRALWLRSASLRARVARLQAQVLPTLLDNQALAAKSQQVGQIGLLERIVIQRQTLDARRDLLDALADLHTTRIALERAAGWE